jgi:general secretion pathway protein E/type IV pilus assembly protein PilB
LLDAVLAEAVRQGASDIHFQPGAAGLALRYRVDGVLRLAHSLHRDYWPPLAVRVKVLAGLDIAESRAPQDGRFSQQVAGREIDFRVASLPTTQGENIVLRVLDRARGIVPLTGLGLDEASLQRLRLMVARPSGLMLVCGPTGSGKTTTLYSLLNHLNSPAVNIMTLEDPVEYPLADIRQTSLAEGLRLDFASGVRALLRQDPDILLIGEIRDEDTAAMALRPECIEWVMANALERRLLGMAEGEQRKHPRPTASARQAVHGGYAGRIALMELLRVDRALDELIARNAGPRELTLAARGAGFVGLAEVASERVLAGLTTLEEIARVVDLTPRVEALP